MHAFKFILIFLIFHRIKNFSSFIFFLLANVIGFQKNDMTNCSDGAKQKNC